MRDTKAIDKAYILPTYNRNDAVLVAGKGCYAMDENGKTYLDFTSGIGVNSLGYCDPAWVAAVCEQTGMLQHTSNLYYTAPAPRLAQQLCQRTGLDKVFFCNSGAEANEGAIKAARKYSFAKYGAHRSKIITLQNSFHGRTLATLTATGQEEFHQYFDPFLPDIVHVQAGDFDALTAQADGACAVLMELVQGEGGVVALDKSYVHKVYEWCKERDILFMIDEVQTGVGRTGRFLCCEHYDILPDVVTLAKGLGGGLPIGAFLLGPTCAGALGPGDHGSTFGGNPVVCAGALSVMDRLDETFLQTVEEKGTLLRTALQALPQVESVSGVGLILGAQLRAPYKASEVVKRCLSAGLLLLTAKDKLRFLPPLIISQRELTSGVDIIKTVLEEMKP